MKTACLKLHQIEALNKLLLAKHILFLLCSAGLIISCGNTGNESVNNDAGWDQDGSDTPFVTEVEVMVVEKGSLPLELSSNGKLRASRKSRISYPFSEELENILVKNGQQVHQGQGLAQLNRRNLERQLEQARLRFARVSISMEDLLLSRGYSLKDSLEVPHMVWHIASINSGYAEALQEVSFLENELEKTLIRAPYSGVVGGINARVFEKVGAGEVFCTLIDNTAFLAEFPVMESELALLQVGAGVEVEPFGKPGKLYSGQIVAINPMVDDHGRVEVTARVTGTAGLLDGMNVRVRVQREVPGQMLVPRSAVLYRDNSEVLFKYIGGIAEWTYVNIPHENSTHFSVVADPDRVASLQPGDTVIVSGNINLTHGSKVNISQKAW